MKKLRKIEVITPETIFDLFLLCLYWRYNGKKTVNNPLTGNKFFSILLGAGVITHEDCAKFEWVNINSLFAMRCLRVSSDKSWERWERFDLIIASPCPICVISDMMANVDHSRILTNYELYISHKGVGQAKKLEKIYRHVFNLEAYKLGLAHPIRRKRLRGPRKEE